MEASKLQVWTVYLTIPHTYMRLNTLLHVKNTANFLYLLFVSRATGAQTSQHFLPDFDLTWQLQTTNQQLVLTTQL
jgi:hypothetical protein